MATLTKTIFILIDLILNCLKTFCNFLILLGLRESYYKLIGLYTAFYRLLCDIDSAITWKMIKMASCLRK